MTNMLQFKWCNLTLVAIEGCSTVFVEGKLTECLNLNLEGHWGTTRNSNVATQTSNANISVRLIIEVFHKHVGTVCILYFDIIQYCTASLQGGQCSNLPVNFHNFWHIYTRKFATRGYILAHLVKSWSRLFYVKFYSLLQKVQIFTSVVIIANIYGIVI